MGDRGRWASRVEPGGALRRWLGWVGVAWAAACGSPPPSTLVVDNSLNVTVYADGSRGQAPREIDADDPRVGVARAKIKELLGQELGFELDAALVTQFGDNLHEAYVAALEQTATALVSCQKYEPKAFAFGAPRLRFVRLVYSPVLVDQAATLDLASSTLPVAVRADSRRLLEGHELCSAFSGALAEDRARRFAAVEAADVAEQEQEAYVDHLLKDESRGDTRAERDLDELTQTTRLLAFYPRIKDPKVRESAERRLRYFGARLRALLAEPPPDPKVAAALGKAHSAWIRWVNASSARLGDADREAIANLVFLRSHESTAAFIQGFDTTTFGLPIVDRWIENAPLADPRKSENQLEQSVVCPYTRGSNSSPALSVRRYCTGAFYIELSRTPAGAKRLAALLLERQNDVLTQSAVLHTLRELGTPAIFPLMEALAHDAPATRAALRGLADYDDWRPSRGSSSDAKAPDPAPLVARIPGWWKSHPERRPVLLYLLTRIGEQREGTIAWPKLAQFLGRGIDDKELAGFLAEEPRAIWSVLTLAPALSPGWPRSRVLVPGLEAWFEAEAQQRGGSYGPYYVTERVVTTLCAAGTRADLEALQKALRSHIELYPSQRRPLASFVQQSPEALCPKFTRPKQPKRAEPVLFGD